VVEEVKWRKPSNPTGAPVSEHDGIVCTGETYQEVKLTFPRGAALDDPSGLFNSSLEGNLRPSIFMKARRSMPRRSKRSSAPPWH
jgi:hypothetical protein